MKASLAVSRRLRQSFAVVLLLASSLVGVTPSLADSVTIEGLSFRVDSVTPVESTMMRVKVGDEEVLVPREELHDAIVALSFSPSGKGRTINPDELGKFIEQSMADGKVGYAAAALPFYVSSPTLDVLGAVDVLERTARFANAAEAFKKALLEIRSHGDVFAEFRTRPELVAVVLFTIGKEDGAWLRANALRWVFTFSESFRGYVVDRLSKDVAAERFDEVEAIPQVIQDALGDDHEFFLSTRLLVQRILQVANHESNDPAESLYPLVEAARRDAISARILYPLVADKLQLAAERALSEGSPARALIVASRTDPARRTPRTHDILIRALQSLPASDVEALRDGEVEQMLTALALRDAEVRKHYEYALFRQFENAMADSDVVRGGLIMGKMLKCRPDPYPANDDMRVELALAQLRIGSREGALDVLAGIRTGIPLYDRVRLGLAGLYVSRLIAFLCIVVPGIYTVWFLIVELRRLRSYRLHRSSQARGEHARYENASSGVSANGSDSSAYERNGGKAFTHSGIKKPTDPRLAEYEKCLGVLGLEPAASLREIKTAYRSLVKHIHPDRLKENQGLASDRFIELTQAYDRAIELRRQTGMEE